MVNKKQKKNKSGGQQFLSDKQFVRQRMQTLPIGDCYITSSITENGEGYVVVSRTHTGGRISFACYLVDAWCCGVKDSLFKLRLEDYEFEDFIKHIDGQQCSYEEAHNWVYGSIAYAEEAGIAPDKSFLLTKYFLQEDTDDIPLIEFDFGKDGKHCLVAHSRLEASRYLPLLKKNLGEGRFDYILPGEMADDPYLDDEEDVNQVVARGDQPETSQILRTMSKEALLYLNMQLWLNLDSSHDVYWLRREYRKQVFSEPERILMFLSNEDINILKAYIEAKNEHHTRSVGILIPEAHHHNMLELTGLAWRRFEDDGEYRMYVAADFAEKVTPIIDNVSNSDDFQRIRFVECFIEGLANLYGDVSIEYVKQQLRKHFDLGNNNEVQKVLDYTYDHSLSLKMSYHTTINDVEPDSNEHFDRLIFFMTRYGWRDFKREHDILSRIDMPHREFSKNEIINAGYSGGVVIPNAHQQEFEAFLRLIGHENDAQDICFDLWFFAAHEGDRELGSRNYKTYFEDVVISASAKEMAKQNISREEAMQQMEEYMNHMPRWTLRGHSPAESAGTTAVPGL